MTPCQRCGKPAAHLWLTRHQMQLASMSLQEAESRARSLQARHPEAGEALMHLWRERNLQSVSLCAECEEDLSDGWRQSRTALTEQEMVVLEVHDK